MNFSEEEQKQYSRHLILDEIGEEGQLKLKQAKVLVIGAGGLSCPVLQYLAAAGVGTIGIVDGDHIEQSNLQRQILYSHNDLGQFKAEVAAKKLNALNPYIQVIPHLEMLDKDNALEIFSDYDIVVDGSDNFPTRYLSNDAAVILDKPLVFGSIFKFDGQVTVFNYKEGPTYRCLYPEAPEPDAVPNCSEIGVLGVLPGIIGALQANEVVKMICEIGEVLSGKLLSLDALSMQQTVLQFAKNEALNITSLYDNYEAFCGIQPVSDEITWEEYQDNKTSYELLDVRSKNERAKKNLGGIHIPLDQLVAKQRYLPKSNRVIVYCQSGVRSKRAIEILKELGVKKTLLNLKGGVGTL